jgi:hypothetical protein
MSFPFVMVNVFLLFAIAIAISCWGFALIPIWRAKMRTITCVPMLLGLIGAAYVLVDGGSIVAGLVGLVVTAFLANMFLAFVYGWTRKGQFDAADRAAGIGRFGPVMILWTCALFYVAIATIVNTTLTGTAIPFRHALGAAG